MNQNNSIKIVLVVLLFIAIYFPAFISLSEKFTATDSYYSHGFLVPIVCGYLVWRKRRELKELPIESFAMGMPILIIGLLLQIIATALKINFAIYASMIIVILGMVLFMFGIKITKLLFPAILFMLFMIPLPGVVIIGISFKLKVLAAEVATRIIHALGITATRAGSIIYLPNSKLLVGDPCSGLRSLISLLALGALFTQFVDSSKFRKLLLFFSSIPIALVSNILRILFLLFVAYIYGEKVATGTMHDVSGMLVFVIAFIF